jgi:hypothetical protein
VNFLLSEESGKGGLFAELTPFANLRPIDEAQSSALEVVRFLVYVDDDEDACRDAVVLVVSVGLEGLP